MTLRASHPVPNPIPDSVFEHALTARRRRADPAERAPGLSRMAPGPAALRPVGAGRGCGAGTRSGRWCGASRPRRPAPRQLSPPAAHHPRPVRLLDRSPEHPDDFGPAALGAQLAALQAQAPALRRGNRPAGQLQLGALPRRAGSWTAASMPCVAPLTGEQPEPGGPYTPHVTVGLYGGAWPTARVQAQLDGFDGGRAAIHCSPIERLSLMSYAAPEIGGPLETLADFCSITQQLVWRKGGQTSPLARLHERTAATP